MVVPEGAAVSPPFLEKGILGIVYIPRLFSFLLVFFPFLLFLYIVGYVSEFFGDIAQLARASALQAEGQGFEPPYLHK